MTINDINGVVNKFNFSPGNTFRHLKDFGQ